MLVNVAYAAIGACLALAVVCSMLATARRSGMTGEGRGTLETYLLAGGGLSRYPIVQLLVSSAFALNGLFYQIWLGYSVGAWGLVTQIAWMLGYWLLAPQTWKIRTAKSLHDLVGTAFGSRTRMVAAACSLLGFVAMMGWEVAISRETFTDILVAGGGVPAGKGPVAGAWLSGLTVFVCLIYTVYGGLRGNSVADTIQNSIKLAGFGLIALLLFSLMSSSGRSASDFWSALFPPLDKMEKNLGYFALATNIVFSLCWQTVDASTWQSVLASVNRDARETRWSLFLGGLGTLIAPGILGTVLGVALAYTPGITPDNVLFKSIETVGLGSAPVMFIIFFAIACCVMSLLDGLLLASGYAIIIDFIHPNASLSEIDRSERRAVNTLIALRLFLVALAVFAAWGVHALLKLLDLKLFDFVYLVIIPQLALFGPVVMALAGRSGRSMSMAFVIAGAFAAGVLATIAGQRGVPYLGDSAGTISTLLSLGGAFLASRPSGPAVTTAVQF